MSLVTYSPKVFIPLTKLCRDVCHYCTFAQPPRRGERAYMSADEVLGVARAGAEVSRLLEDPTYAASARRIATAIGELPPAAEAVPVLVDLVE